MALYAPTTSRHSLSHQHFPSTKKPRNHAPSVIVRSSSSHVSNTQSGNVAEFEEGQLDRPKWAGETPLSRLVGALISFKPLYSILKIGARQVLISTAEKTNVAWREMTKEVLDSQVYKEFDTIQDPSLVYPDCGYKDEVGRSGDMYGDSPLGPMLPNSWFASVHTTGTDYLNPFHAYDEGNLSWLAAAEAEPATMSMVRRAIPYASSLDEANQIVRGNWLLAIETHHAKYSGNYAINDILDIGCSVGVSTGFLADRFPSAKVTGLDLSPYFLAVAQFKERKRAARRKPISWIHANGEATGLASKSFDLVSLAYVLHECPERAIVGLLKEALRLLRPGGMIALTDNSPKSKILQELSPVLFTLMKSTEPFLDEYYLTDLEGRMREVGFVNVCTTLTDPRHRTVVGTVPY